jgi:hypothetical protein
MERHYTNGTEPDVLPHWECHGPCHQGRAPCPTPDACERPGDDQDGVDVLGLATVLVALALVAAVVLGVLL